MTYAALKICTPEQFDAIKIMLEPPDKTTTPVRSIRVFVDFSLPDGWLYFVLTKRGNMENADPIHGGIDPEGGIST
jgi:hypothetical protein